MLTDHRFFKKKWTVHLFRKDSPTIFVFEIDEQTTFFSPQKRNGGASGLK